MSMPVFRFGPYPAADGLRVIYHPSLPDHLLDAAALLVVLATWAGLLWVHLGTIGPIGPENWMYGGFSIACFLLMSFGSRAPVGCISFPVRVNADNIGWQYTLAVRTVRVSNVLMCLGVGSTAFSGTFAWTWVVSSVSFILLGVTIVAYYVLAFLKRK